ncbi:MAG TPA: basic secretory protein-like protein [Pirellulaceae bacterium]|nr:basic secretory protein-like protein [Pirellulaceae bacterium]
MSLFVPRAALLACALLSAVVTESLSAEAVAARVESSLATESKNIRQFALDGRTETYFGSTKPPQVDDHFTVKFAQPVKLRAISVVAGKLTDAVLEISADGEQFSEAAKFIANVAVAEPKEATVQAVRVRVTRAAEQPLALREITIESDPPVATFTYPVEFVIDVSDAPEMKAWAEKAVLACEQAYPMINEELASSGFRPASLIRMTLRKDYRGVAETSGDRILGSVKFFTEHPDDIGAMVHETVHVVQQYRGRGNPGWLVEGVADYVRFFKYEPEKRRKPDPRRARYDASYQTTADFLGYVTAKYDLQLVRKLNAAMREGSYKEEMFKEMTGKTVQELGEEWQATLR